MLLCALLTLAPLALAVVAPVVAILGTLEGAAHAVTDTTGSTSVIAAPASDSWVGREVDRRGRILPRRDARGRFIRSDAN